MSQAYSFLFKKVKSIGATVFQLGTREHTNRPKCAFQITVELQHLGFIRTRKFLEIDMDLHNAVTV